MRYWVSCHWLRVAALSTGALVTSWTVCARAAHERAAAETTAPGAPIGNGSFEQRRDGEPESVLSGPDGTIAPADLTPDGDGWIALAPLVRENCDLQDAGWKWDGRSAAFSAGKPRAFVSIPVRIAGSYELQTRVTITRAKEVTAIYLPISGTRAVVLGMRGDRGNSESPTATIRLMGLTPEAEPPGHVSIDIGTEYALACKVLVDGDNVSIAIRRNGRVLFQWAGDVAQVAEQNLKRPGTVQLETAYYTTSRFTGLRLRMLSGRAIALFSE